MPQKNFYDAELVNDSDGKYAVELENVHVTLSDEKQENLARNQVKEGPVTLGRQAGAPAMADKAETKISGTVEVSEMMGSAVHLHIRALRHRYHHDRAADGSGRDCRLPDRQRGWLLF